MNLFEKTYRDIYLKYHNNPIARNSLDPRVFMFSDEQGDPILVDAVRTHILNDIQSINNIEGIGTMTRVQDYVLVGPVLDEQSAEDCTVVILVQLNTYNLQDVLKERILNHVTRTLNKRLLTGTVHPVKYKLLENTINIKDYTAVYKPFTNVWVKKPRFLGK